MLRALLFTLGALTLGCGDEAPMRAPPLDASPADDRPMPVDASAVTDGAPLPTPDGGRSTVYYVIRHAERDPGDDPPINTEGMQRAQRLVGALGRAGIEEIVVTSYQRTGQTAAPLSAQTRAPVTTAPIARTGWPDMGRQVGAWQRMRERPGSTTLMVGHSGGYNVALLQALGAQGLSLSERYQDLVVLVREPDGTVRTSVLEYGGRSSLDF